MNAEPTAAFIPGADLVAKLESELSALRAELAEANKQIGIRERAVERRRKIIKRNVENERRLRAELAEAVRLNGEYMDKATNAVIAKERAEKELESVREYMTEYHKAAYRLCAWLREAHARANLLKIQLMEAGVRADFADLASDRADARAESAERREREANERADAAEQMLLECNNAANGYTRATRLFGVPGHVYDLYAVYGPGREETEQSPALTAMLSRAREKGE